jgi:hypothetical protein
MAEVVVTQFQLDIGQFEAQLNKATKGMEGFDKSTDGAEDGTKDLGNELGSASKKLTLLDRASKQAGKGLDEFGKKGAGVAGAFKDVGKELNAAFPAFGRVAGAVQKLGVAFKAALGPVGIIIAVVTAAIAGLIKAFAGTQEGADRLRKVTAVLEIAFDRFIGVAQRLGKAIVDAFTNPREAIIAIGRAIQENVQNRIQAVGEGFRALADVVTNTAAGIALSIKGIFSDDAKAEAEAYFAAAADASTRFGQAVLKGVTGVEDPLGKLRDGFNALTDEINEATKAGLRLAELEKSLSLARIAQAREQGRLNRLFQEQVQIAQDVNRTAEERTAAAREAIAAQDRIATLQKNIITQELAILRLKAAQNDTDREALLLITQKEAELEQVEADRLAASRRVQNQINAIEKQIADQRIAEAKRAEEEARKLQEAREQGQESLDAFLAEKRKERELAEATELERRIFRAQDAAAKEIEEARKLADALRAISEETDLPGIKQQEADIIRLIEQQLAEDLKAIREGADADELERLAEVQAQRLDLLRDVSSQASDIVTDLAEGSIETADDVSKALLKIALSAAENQALIALGVTKVLSLSQPDSIATFGAAGVARALVIGALIKAAFSVLKSQLAGSFYDGGIVGKDGGTKYKNGRDGYLVRAHEGEHIMPTAATRKYLPYLEAMRNGTFEKMLSTTAQLSAFSPSTSTAVPSFSDRRLVGALGTVGSLAEQRKQTALLAMVAQGLNRGRNARYTA